MIVVQKQLCVLNGDCTEIELERFATILHTDLALQFTPPRLEVFSLKVEEGDRT